MFRHAISDVTIDEYNPVSDIHRRNHFTPLFYSQGRYTTPVIPHQVRVRVLSILPPIDVTDSDLDVSTALLYYSFDSSTVSGTTLHNLGTGGSAYDATLVSSPTISTTDVVVGTGSIQFSAGSSQYVTIPSFSTSSAGLSFAFWFKFNGCSANCRIFDFGNGAPSDNLYFHLSTTNDFLAHMYLGTSNFGVPTGSGLNVNDGQWRHLAWTVDARGNWMLYLNGVLISSYLGLVYPNAISRTSNYLGKSPFGSPYLNGAIDDFYVYQSLLTAAQVQDLYQRGEGTLTCGFMCPLILQLPLPSLQ